MWSIINWNFPDLYELYKCQRWGLTFLNVCNNNQKTCSVMYSSPRWPSVSRREQISALFGPFTTSPSADLNVKGIVPRSQQQTDTVWWHFTAASGSTASGINGKNILPGIYLMVWFGSFRMICGGGKKRDVTSWHINVSSKHVMGVIYRV